MKDQIYRGLSKQISLASGPINSSIEEHSLDCKKTKIQYFRGHQVPYHSRSLWGLHSVHQYRRESLPLQLQRAESGPARR